MTEFYWAFEDDLFTPGSGVDLERVRGTDRRLVPPVVRRERADAGHRHGGQRPACGGASLRVLHLGFEDPAMPGAGGGSLRTHEINRRLAADGMDVTVLTSRFPGCTDRVQDGVRYVHVGAGLRLAPVADWSATCSGCRAPCAATSPSATPTSSSRTSSPRSPAWLRPAGPAARRSVSSSG